MFYFQNSQLEQHVKRLEEEYFAEHANLFPVTGMQKELEILAVTTLRPETKNQTLR